MQTYHEGVQYPNGDPEAPPHGVDDRHQGITGLEPLQARDELREAAKDPHEREEDGRRVRRSPPVGDVAGRDPSATGESGQPERGRGCYGLEEDLDSWRLLQHLLAPLLIMVVAGNGHFYTEFSFNDKGYSVVVRKSWQQDWGATPVSTPSIICGNIIIFYRDPIR